MITVGAYRKWAVVGLLWIVTCLNYMDRMTLFAIFPLLHQEMHLSNVALAMLGSVFLWAYGLCSPVGGYLGDRFNRKSVILASLVIFSVVTFATGWAQNQSQLVTLRVLLGVSEALYLPAALAHIATFHSNATRSLANALALTALPAGAGLGGFYGGFMAEHYSWRIGFYWLGAFGLLLCIVLVALLPNEGSATKELRTGELAAGVREPVGSKMLGVLRNRTSLCLIFLAAALSLTSWPLGSWMPTYFYERFGMSLTRAGFILGLVTYTPALVGSVAGGIWADRWAKTNGKGRIWVQVIALSLMSPTMLAVGFIPAVGPMSFNLLLYSLARGTLEVNSMPIFSNVMSSGRWATAYGLYNLAGTLAGSLGILFVGVMKESWGIGRSLSLMSAFLFSAIIVMALTPSRNATVPSPMKGKQARPKV
jgi:MFS transporter, Spinster family, sphingosine-1-phosphate transporter